MYINHVISPNTVPSAIPPLSVFHSENCPFIRVHCFRSVTKLDSQSIMLLENPYCSNLHLRPRCDSLSNARLMSPKSIQVAEDLSRFNAILSKISINCADVDGVANTQTDVHLEACHHSKMEQIQ